MQQTEQVSSSFKHFLFFSFFVLFYQRITDYASKWERMVRSMTISASVLFGAPFYLRSVNVCIQKGSNKPKMKADMEEWGMRNKNHTHISRGDQKGIRIANCLLIQNRVLSHHIERTQLLTKKEIFLHFFLSSFCFFRFLIFLFFVFGLLGLVFFEFINKWWWKKIYRRMFKLIFYFVGIRCCAYIYVYTIFCMLKKLRKKLIYMELN